MALKIRLRLQAPHLSKRQSPSISKTPIQGVESQGYPQEMEDDQKNRPMQKLWFSFVTVFCVFLHNSWQIYISFCVLVESVSPVRTVWSTKFFKPVAAVLLFNICDLSGRTMATFFLWPGKRLFCARTFFGWVNRC